MPDLTPLVRPGRLPIVRSLIGTVLLLLQLTPVLGAAACMHMATHSAESCSMTMPPTTHGGDGSSPVPLRDCALMIVCTPTNTVVPAVAMQNFGSVQPATTNFSSPPSLFVGDNVAPPQPPPIV